MKKERCFIRYCLLTAQRECGIYEHPQRQMISLGYKLIRSVPHSVADCWIFEVDKYIEPFPPYLEKTIGLGIKED